MSDPRTAGQGMGDKSNQLLGALMSVMLGLLPVGMVIVGVGFDLWLGQVYMTAHAVEGVDDPGLRQYVPWLYTLGTTGIQYAVIDRTRRGLSEATRWTKTLIGVGWFVAIADTLTDIGGFTAWRYGDNVQGANIMPDAPDIGWWFGALFFGFLCLMHERLFQEILARREWAAAASDLPLAGIERVGVKAAGYLLNITKAVVMPIGIVSMIFLDIYLTPQFMGVEFGDVVGWAMSFILTALNFGLWEHLEKVGIKNLPKGSRAVIAVGWGFAIFDTLCDVWGYTTMVYGDGSSWLFFPDPINATWLITAMIIGSLCFAGEPLAKETVRGNIKIGTGGGWGGGSGSSGGSSGWGGGSGNTGWGSGDKFAF